MIQTHWVGSTHDAPNPATPLDPAKALKVFHDIEESSHLSGHRPCDLRHTFATLNLMAAVPLGYVSKQLGHKSVTTTLKVLLQMAPERGRHALGGHLGTKTTERRVSSGAGGGT